MDFDEETKAVLAKLRAAGYAVVAFSPNEVSGFPGTATQLEAALVEYGNTLMPEPEEEVEPFYATVTAASIMAKEPCDDGWMMFCEWWSPCLATQEVPIPLVNCLASNSPQDVLWAVCAVREEIPKDVKISLVWDVTRLWTELQLWDGPGTSGHFLAMALVNLEDNPQDWYVPLIHAVTRLTEIAMNQGAVISLRKHLEDIVRKHFLAEITG